MRRRTLSRGKAVVPVFPVAPSVSAAIRHDGPTRGVPACEEACGCGDRSEGGRVPRPAASAQRTFQMPASTIGGPMRLRGSPSMSLWASDGHSPPVTVCLRYLDRPVVAVSG